jgi:hypothetical protein
VGIQVRMMRHFRKSLITLLASRNRVSLNVFLKRQDLGNSPKMVGDSRPNDRAFF